MLHAGRSGVCSYVHPAAGVPSSYEHQFEVIPYSEGQALDEGLVLETYSHPPKTTSVRSIPNLGQLAEIVTVTYSPLLSASALLVYRNNRIALSISYGNGPVTDVDIKGATVITNALLGPYDGQIHAPTVSAPPVVHTSPATYGLASPDCRVITEAVHQIFSHPTRGIITEMPARDGCSYNVHDTLANRKDVNIIVTLYGERGEPIGSYHRPSESYRTIPNLGQLAEYINLSDYKTLLVLYRNNRRVLDIGFSNYFPNPAISGATRLIGSLLGPYKTQDAPLSEPKGPPK